MAGPTIWTILTAKVYFHRLDRQMSCHLADTVRHCTGFNWALWKWWSDLSERNLEVKICTLGNISRIWSDGGWTNAWCMTRVNTQWIHTVQCMGCSALISCSASWQHAMTYNSCFWSQSCQNPGSLLTQSWASSVWTVDTASNVIIANILAWPSLLEAFRGFHYDWIVMQLILLMNRCSSLR